MSRPPGPGDPAAVQRRIRQAREQLLGGRGPGASPLETARWMSERPSLGGQDPAATREAVAERAAVARGDPDALAWLTARHSARLAATLRTVTYRFDRARRRARIAVPAALAVSGAVLALLKAGKHRRGQGRSAASHPGRGLPSFPPVTGDTGTQPHDAARGSLPMIVMARARGRNAWPSSDSSGAAAFAVSDGSLDGAAGRGGGPDDGGARPGVRILAGPLSRHRPGAASRTKRWRPLTPNYRRRTRRTGHSRATRSASWPRGVRAVSRYGLGHPNRRRPLWEAYLQDAL